MKEVTRFMKEADRPMKEVTERGYIIWRTTQRQAVCSDRWHIDGPSGGLHAYIDEVLSAAPPDVEGSTLQAHFAPPRWRMPPPPLSHALENMLRRNGSNPLPPPSSGRGAKLAANTTTKVHTRGTVPPHCSGPWLTECQHRCRLAASYTHDAPGAYPICPYLS